MNRKMWLLGWITLFGFGCAGMACRIFSGTIHGGVVSGEDIVTFAHGKLLAEQLLDSFLGAHFVASG